MHPEHPMRHGYPPAWADGYGFDAYGPYAEVYIDAATLRFRWIPPGDFQMGSPEGEAGRYDREVQHVVTISAGYWLADAPVTQRLWQAVTGENPSRFEHPDRPVEQVSFEDVEAFIAQLNARDPELAARLPAEAEWEYACRAGTKTATYAGDLEILGAHNALVLDAISWYGGNSGVDYDLEEGHDASGWSDKQYAFDTAGSRIVRKKQPNAWGLYGMLGNVWEWCADWHGDYTKAPAVDPTGPEEGAGRVLRGGSWFYVARRVRAAYRGWGRPGDRDHDLGVRLARGPAPSARRAEPPRSGAADPSSGRAEP